MELISETTRDISSITDLECVDLAYEKPYIRVDYYAIVEIIKNEVLDYYKQQAEEVFSYSRKKEISQSRGLIMHFIRHYTVMPLVTIGVTMRHSTLKPMDHSTVLHGLENVSNWRVADKAYNNDFEIIKARLKELITNG